MSTFIALGRHTKHDARANGTLGQPVNDPGSTHADIFMCDFAYSKGVQSRRWNNNHYLSTAAAKGAILYRQLEESGVETGGRASLVESATAGSGARKADCRAKSTSQPGKNHHYKVIQ